MSTVPPLDPKPATERSQGSELARLRDRTDEIELIISGLTMVALFTLPGWLFERIAESFTHLSVSLLVSSTMMLVVLTGLCYGLGACFLVHLMARAYWVGLIGLRTVFPEGINWERTPGIGPLTRERYRAKLPDLKAAIERSDRLASSLFAVISVIALGILWIGMLLASAGTLGGLIGSRFGATNLGITTAFAVLVALTLGLPALTWLFDAQLGARWPKLQGASWFRSFIGGLARANGWLFPQRLVLPVQLTLQSNTRPVLFLAIFTLAIIAVIVVGQVSYNRAATFTLSGEFIYLDDQHLSGPVFRSSYYEDMRESRDRLQAWPMIPSFEQRGSHLRLFLPYQPLRDNMLLDKLCPGEDARLGAACLLRMWTVTLNGVPINTSGFLAAERRDLRMRGLVGAVPLYEVAPGLQLLEIIWNASSAPGEAPMDDRYANARLEHRIPFLFTPDYERDLDAETGRTGRPPAEPDATHPTD